MAEEKKLRIDKYLWAIRIFKTRSIASTACNDGRIKLDDNPVKASRIVKIGDVYEIRFESKKTTIKVTQLLDKRMSAQAVEPFYENLTPVEEIKEKSDSAFFFPSGKRGNRQARPTKKDRRTMNEFKGDV